MNFFCLFYKMAKIAVLSQVEYKTSFVMVILSTFIASCFDFFGIWILFDRFKTIEGWTLPELALIYGIVQIGFSLADIFSRSFDRFSLLVKRGEFDRMLLRPLGTLFQVATREFELVKFGKLLQGSIVLIFGVKSLNLLLFSWHALVILLAIIGTMALFYGIFIIQATISFWTVETLEIMNIATYGGRDASIYPMSIYRKTFRLFFTFVIPLACVAYYPVAGMLRHENFPLVLGMVAPVTGIGFLWVACQIWKIGVKRYHSTGS